MPDIVEIYRKEYEEFKSEFEKIISTYEENKDETSAREQLQKLASKHRNHYGICNIFLLYGIEVFDKGEKEHGYKILQIGMNTFKNAPNHAGVFMRFVQYCMEHNQADKAEEYLLEVCNGRDNYEEVIEWEEMTEVWEKYKYLVAGKVPLPIRTEGKHAAAKLPDECSMQIKDILQLPEQKLLNELSTHLWEMSGQGEEMVCLNKWEKIIFDTDALLSEVGSGGVDSWLHSYGQRFTQTKKALAAIGAEKGLQFLEEIEKRFPRGKVPKSYERIEAILDKMLDNDEDFEEEESQYYYDAGVEGELVECMYQFVMDNKKKFR